LLQICSNDLIKFEKEYEKDGVDLRSKLKSDTISQFLAPKYLHEKIKLLLLEMSQIETISKDFQCSAQLIKSKKQELNKLATKNRCLMTITSSTQPTVPTTSKISSGSIHISNDDLTTEQVKSEMKKIYIYFFFNIYSLMFLLFVQHQRNFAV
jgi:hypothetical protein